MRIKLMIIQQQLCYKLIFQDRMGTCAGIKDPQRRYRTEGNQLPNKFTSQAKKYEYSSPPIVNAGTHQSLALDALKTYAQPASPKHNMMTNSTKDPWKSRIGSRSVKKYERKPTLKQQQQDYRKLSVFDQPPAKSIREESLDESIYARQNMSPEEAKEKYKSQFKHEFCEKEEEIKQILFDSSIIKRKNSPKTPVARRMKTEQYAPTYSYQYEESAERTNIKQPSYMPKKIDRIRNKQLAEIMQLVQKDAQTPSYVKDLRKQQGEDIKMNNFNKFEPVGSFEWFSLGKYLGQIQRVEGDESIDKLEKFDRDQIKLPSQIRNQNKIQEKFEGYTPNPKPRKTLSKLIIEEEPEIPATKISLKVK